MTRIVGVAPVLPEHRYPQAEITQAFLDLCLDDDGTHSALVRRLHASAQVEARHLAYPLETYPKFDTFAAANDAYIDAAVDLGAQALAQAVADAGLDLSDVDVLVSTSVTGIAVPSIDARISARLGLRGDIVRLPLFGLGCAGGAGGIARLHDLLSARPDAVGVLVAVEICSLTSQRRHDAVPHLVASALFGDGAAAVVAVGEAHPLATDRPRARVIETASRLYPDSERAMGWDIGEWGLRIVLDAEVPALIEAHLAADVDALLARSGIERRAIDPWICHPGGPKVLGAVEQCLELAPGVDGALHRTWASLREVGNLSSASVLHVLTDTLRNDPPQGDRDALLLAMGPGFASELVLLRW